MLVHGQEEGEGHPAHQPDRRTPGRCRSVTTGSSATARCRRSWPPVARWTGCACRASTRRACSAAILGRRAGVLPGRAAGRDGPGRPPLPARHDDPGDQLGHPDRLDHRARRAADRSMAPRAGPLRHLPPHAERLRGRAHPAAHHPLRVRRGADHHGLRAGARLRPRATSAGSTPARATTRARRRGPTDGPTSSSPSPPTCGWASRAGRPAPAPCSRRATSVSSPCPGAAPCRRPPSPTPTSGRCGRPTTGSTGWRAASSPTTRGAATCSAAR